MRLSPGHFRGVDTGVFTAVEDAVRVELTLGVTLAPAEELLLLLKSSMKSVRPFGPPHVSVALPLHGMLQRPSVTGLERAFKVFPQ